MSIIFKPLSNDLYSIPKAQILFQPKGSDRLELLGDADAVTLTPTVTETERYTNEGGVRILAKTIVTQVDAELGLTLVQLSNQNRALSLLGALEYVNQAEISSGSLEIEDVDHSDKIYQVGALDLTDVVITDGDGVDPVPYVLGVDYRLDAKAGFIQFMNMPAGADGDVSITYKAPAITDADELAKIGIANRTENRGKLIIRGTNEVGPQVMLTLHDVQLRPTGERTYISETELDTIEVTGRVFRDENQSGGFELGFEQLIPQ